MSQRDYPFFPSDLSSTVLNRALWRNTILFLKQKFTSERAPSPRKLLFLKKEKEKKATSSKSSPEKPILLKVRMKSPLLAKDLSQQDFHVVFCRQKTLIPAKLIPVTLLCYSCGVPRVLKLQHLGWARNPDHTTATPSVTALGSAGAGFASIRCEVPAVPPSPEEES